MEGKNPFRDVTGKAIWGGDPHILHLYRKGILEGKNGGDRFDPDGTLTRAEFLAMLMRAAGIEPEPNEGEDVFPRRFSQPLGIYVRL